MTDMHIKPKPQHLVVGEKNTSARELLLALAEMVTEDMAIAVVFSNCQGDFYTYQFGCDSYELDCCGEALTEWAANYDAELVIAKAN